MTRKNDNPWLAGVLFCAIILVFLLVEAAYLYGVFGALVPLVLRHPLRAMAVGAGFLFAAMCVAVFERWRDPMTDVKIVLEKNLEVMASGRECFNYGVTPVIRPQVAAVKPELRQAWWDGLLAGLVEAMVITIGEKATIEVCEDLYTRSKDAKADVDRALEKMRRGH